MAVDEKILDLRQRTEKVRAGGGEKAIEKQKAIGKMTARERIAALLDADSFQEYDTFVQHTCTDFGMQGKEIPADGVVIGIGTIGGRPVAVFAQDFTVVGGSLGLMHARKITKIMDYALNMRMPLIGINDSGGARTLRTDRECPLLRTVRSGMLRPDSQTHRDHSGQQQPAGRTDRDRRTENRDL